MCHVLAARLPPVQVFTTFNDIWIQQAGPATWPLMKSLSQTANRLLMREPPPSGPLQARPHPMPAHWDSLKNMVDVQEFHVGVDASHADLLGLRNELMKMPCYMLTLAGHLSWPDLQLGVTNMMRRC
ncbi:TPA: hypothetical protein ACH3X1_010742 [Trebouxia sp. C0004]